MSVETWKDIPGWEGYYQVSDQSRVKSLSRLVPHRCSKTGFAKWPERILKPGLTVLGYRYVTFCQSGKTKNFPVHRLVLLTFIGPCPEGKEACHNNGIKTDNSPENLRWDTKSENNKDRFRHGYRDPTERPVQRSDGKSYRSISEAARLTNGNIPSIWRVCQKGGKTSGGYGWSYAE